MHPGRILRTFSHLKVIRISVAEPYDVGIDETGNHIIAMYHIIATSRPRSQRCAYFIIISCRYYYQSPTSLLSVVYVLIISLRILHYYQSSTSRPRSWRCAHLRLAARRLPISIIIIISSSSSCIIIIISSSSSSSGSSGYLLSV